MTLSHSPEKVVGKSVLAEAGQSFVINLESRDVGFIEQSADDPDIADGRESHTGLGDGLLGVGLNSGGLVALSVDEAVVDDADAAVVLGKQRDLVGNGLGIGEGGDVLADVGEAEEDLLGSETGQLSLGLVTEDNDVGVGVGVQHTASSLGQTRVNTTAETLVGTGHDEESLLVLQSLGLGLLEDGVGGLTVIARLIHGLLSAGKTGRGNDLHGVGDLLDVLDGLETALNLTQSREVGGIGRGSALVQVSNRYRFFVFSG